MTDYQTDDTLKGRIAANRQIIAHCENEIKQIESVLKARSFKLKATATVGDKLVHTGEWGTEFKIPEGFILHDGGPCPVDALEVEVINKITGKHFVYSPSIVAWDYVSAYRVTKLKPAVQELIVDDVVNELAATLYLIGAGSSPSNSQLTELLNKFATAIIKEARG